MKKIRVAINGLGRIGRAFLKVAEERSELEIVAVNDLGNIANLSYLLTYDTAYGKAKTPISYEEGDEPKLIVGKKKVLFFSEKDPVKLPWRDLDIDIVVESTGVFESYEKAKVHLSAGAKRVVVTAPVKDSPEDSGITGATVLMGINDDSLKICDVSSNASCTTNAGSPIIQILHETVGIEKAILSTVHAYTASQKIVDSPDASDWRRGRAGAQNIVPSSTGAAIAVTKAVKDLEGKFDGISIRVPVITGSIADITFISKRETSVEEINAILEKASKESRWEKVFTVTKEQLVSSDIVGAPHASIADLSFTKVVDGNLVKVLAWYDNEMGYVYSLIEHVVKSGSYTK